MNLYIDLTTFFQIRLVIPNPIHMEYIVINEDYLPFNQKDILRKIKVKMIQSSFLLIVFNYKNSILEDGIHPGDVR